MTSLLTNIARRAFFESLSHLRGGALTLELPDSTRTFGDLSAPLHATLRVHSERFFRRALLDGEVGLGEAFMDGDWSSPDLVPLIRLAVRNLEPIEKPGRLASLFSRLLEAARHRLRDNSLTGSRRNIQAHYDLSNDFFRLFLDASMLYSCGVFQSASDTLELAQHQKLDLICRKLDLKPSDHVLEIGTGWGAFAEHAARHYGCRVTTTTISRQQFEYARARFSALPEANRITLLDRDYRLLEGRFDKLVSIEMFEAVGLRHYDGFFATCDRLLKPHSSALIQTITMNEQSFPAYIRQRDWIQKYIFPGGELASVSQVLQSVARSSRLTLHHAEDFGTHYARTLHDWRRRFHSALADVRALGFDARFERMWDYYLAYCEGAFLERHIGLQQLLFVKTHSQRRLFNEPWLDARPAAVGQPVL